HDRYDVTRWLAHWNEAQLREPGGESIRVLAQALPAPAFRPRDLDRGRCTRRDRRRRSGREERGTSAIQQKLPKYSGSRDERSADTERLSQCAEGDVDLRSDSPMFGATRATLAQYPRPVGIVHIDPRAVLACDRDQPIEWEEGAVHRIDPYHHDDPPVESASIPLEHIGQRRQVEVGKDPNLGSRQPASIDDGGVVQRVRVHDRTGAR